MKKKKNLLLLIIALAFSSFIFGQTTLFFDDFETNTGWTLFGEFQRDQPQGLGGNSLGYPDPAAAYSGSYVLGDDLTGLGLNLGDYENNLTDRADRAESPTIDCSDYANIILNFQRWLGVEHSMWDHAYIDVSNDNGTSWTNVWQNGDDDIFDNAWSLHSVDISAVAIDQAQVKIRFCIGATDETMHGCAWNIDNVEVTGILATTPPGCTTPVYPTDGAINIETSGNLEWNIEPIATGYKIWFGTDGGGTFDPTNIENGTDLGNATTYSYSGLAYSTTHYWKIIPYNANGDATGCSIWSFITTIPVTTPASEDFETFTVASNATGYTNGWSTSPANTTSQFRWNVDNGGTPSSYTGPEVDHTYGTAEGKYLFTEASSGSQNNEAYVYSPVYDLSGLSNPQIIFWYHMYGNKMGELHLDINTGSGWINDVATPLIGQQQTAQGDPWLEKAASLSAYSGQIVKFRFRGIRGNGSRGDMAIDDVSIEEIPTCPAPSGLTTTNITLTTADLDWTENGPATTWEVEWGQTGFTQGSGTTITGITSHPYTLNPPLTPATTYDWYVRSVCGVGDTSIYEGSETFTTLCNPFTAPFSENFDSVTPPDLPNCWYKIVEFIYAYIETSTTSANSPPNSIVMFSSYSPSSAVILTTPQLIDLTSQSNQIRFYAKSDQLSNLIIGTMSDPMDVATFTAYQTINLTATYSEYVIMFGSTYTGTDEYIAFKQWASGNMHYINIDDFVYEPMPACPEPAFVFADNLGITTATLNWTENGTATIWNIEVGAPGFTPGTGTAIQTHTGVTTNPFDISNLTQGTTYDFYVQADCEGGSTSTWVGASFTTLLPGVNCTYPYMITEANFPFSYAGMTTCGFGDDYSNADACNSYYMDGDDFVFEYTPANNTVINIDLTNTDNWVGLFVTNGCPDVGICVAYDEQSGGNPSLNDVALTAGTTYYIIVSTWPAPQCTVFDIDITNAACPEPTNLSTTNITQTTAYLDWTENGSATNWEIEWGPTGFTQGNGTTITGIKNHPYILNPPLSSGTTYDWYVRSDCGDGVYSLWVGPEIFTTTCSPTTVPWFENFDAVTPPALPLCMTKENTNGDAYEWETSAYNAYSSPNKMSIRWNSTLAMDDWFFSEGLQLTGGVTYGVGCYYTNNSSSFTEKLEIYWGSSASFTGMTNGPIFYDDAIQYNGTYHFGSGTFTPATTGTYYVGWHGFSDADQFNLYVDDVFVVRPFTLNMKVFLEGPFNGTDMNTDLNPADLPLTHPYGGSPWNYSGTESVASIPNTNIVDWVLIELRDTTDAQYASGSTKIAQQAAFLQNDGSFVGLDGASNPEFICRPVENDLFVVIWHRNHLGVMSAYPLTETSGIYTYDFTTGADKAYGGANGHKEIGTGIWGMRGGDGNSDGDINNLDKNDIWLPDYGNTGYLNGDFNMDSQVLDDDKIDIWEPNSGKGTQVP